MIWEKFWSISAGHNIEAVHLPASFATFAARLSQICSNVRQPCLIMGKAAPALRQVSQKLRHWRKSLHTCVKPCDSCRKYVVICVNDATFATPVARLAQPCPGWGKHDADHYIAASALPWLATSLANDAGRWIASIFHVRDRHYFQSGNGLFDF